MLNVIDANPVGRYREEDASPTDGVGAGTAGKVAGTTTGAVVPVAPAGVVAGTPGMDAHAVGRCRVEDAHPTDGDGEGN
jgi:hypothetical protein